MKQILLFTIALLWSTNTATAQLQPLFSQPSESYMLLNPAYIPADNLTGDYSWFGGFTHRNQWFKMDGGPQSSLVRLNYVDTDERYSPSNVSIGGYVLYDKIGDLETYAISGKFAYNIDFANNHYLCAGLAVSVNQMRISNDILTNNSNNANDPMIGAITSPNWGIDFSAGLFYHYINSVNNRFFASLSAMSISNVPLSNDNLLSGEVLWHLYSAVGALLGSENPIEISISSRFSEGILSDLFEESVLIGVRGRYQFGAKGWAGLGYFTNNTVEIEAGVFLYDFFTKKSTDRDVKLSMSFMRPWGDIAYYFGNTVEVNLTFLMR
jgi:type IX secretion system PorP/SprF family membrane protein